MLVQATVKVLAGVHKNFKRTRIALGIALNC
jgi:hypothetical protein